MGKKNESPQYQYRIDALLNVVNFNLNFFLLHLVILIENDNIFRISIMNKFTSAYKTATTFISNVVIHLSVNRNEILFLLNRNNVYS